MDEHLLLLSIARHWAITLIERITEHATLKVNCSELSVAERELLAGIPIWSKNYGQNTSTEHRHLWDCRFDGDRLVFHFFKDDTVSCDDYELQFFETDRNSSLLACLFTGESDFLQEALIFWDKDDVVRCGTNPCFAPAHIQERRRVVGF